MDQDAITRHILTAFPNVETTNAFGYDFFFYGSERMMPFATLASQDSDHDSVSNLNRPSVYRLNIGVRKETFRAMFGHPTAKELSGRDFTTLDEFMPHPEYAAQSWLCVLNPAERTLDETKELLAEAHELARERKQRKS